MTADRRRADVEGESLNGDAARRHGGSSRRNLLRRCAVALCLGLSMAVVFVVRNPRRAEDEHVGRVLMASEENLQEDEKQRGPDLQDISRRLYHFPSFQDVGGNGCHITDTDRCPLTEMANTVNWTTVYPGGDTRCITDLQPYSFQVLPGDRDKLFLYFQGGGACWDQGSTLMHLCTRSVRYQPHIGIFDKTNPGNPFKDYTIVHVGYCSGDAHGGNADQPWKGPRGEEDVKQKGYVNTKAVLNWTLSNFGELNNFLIGGSSAGSMAVQLWSNYLLKTFVYKNAAVIADSYAGVFPRRVQGKVIKEFGVCNAELLSDRLQSKCEDETLTIQDGYSEAMWLYPDVTFVSINSKTDIVQMNFHDAMTFSTTGTNELITGPEFYRKVSIIERFYSHNPNHVVFDVNAWDHTYLNTARFYSTIVGGNNLNVWAGRLPLSEGDSIMSKCDGRLGFGPSISGWDWCQPNATKAEYYRSSTAQNVVNVLEKPIDSTFERASHEVEEMLKEVERSA